MAFWAIYGKWWYKRADIPNMIAMYRKQLYDEWYSGLSEEKKKLVDEKIRKHEEEEFKHFRNFMSIGGIISDIYNRRGHIW